MRHLLSIIKIKRERERERERGREREVEREVKRERKRWFWDIIHGLPIIHNKD